MYKILLQFVVQPPLRLLVFVKQKARVVDYVQLRRYSTKNTVMYRTFPTCMYVHTRYLRRG